MTLSLELEAFDDFEVLLFNFFFNVNFPYSLYNFFVLQISIIFNYKYIEIHFKYVIAE